MLMKSMIYHSNNSGKVLLSFYLLKNGSGKMPDIVFSTQKLKKFATKKSHSFISDWYADNKFLVLKTENNFCSWIQGKKAS